MEILQAIDTERIRALRDRGEFFWLDLAGPETSDLEALREDTNEFGQRAKLDDYPHSALLVVYGAESHATERARLVEVHLHISDDALVTVSHEPLAALADACRKVAAKPSAHQGHAVHGVLDALADSFLDTLDRFDDAIDGLQEAVAERPTSAHRQQIFALLRELAEMRRVLLPRRDLLAPVGNLVDAIPQLRADETRDAIRDVHDHLSNVRRDSSVRTANSSRACSTCTSPRCPPASVRRWAARPVDRGGGAVPATHRIRLNRTARPASRPVRKENEMTTANGPTAPEPETWAPAARDQLERTLAGLREQRARLAPTGAEDTTGDYADQAQALERYDDVTMLDRRIDEIRELLARGPRAAEADAADGETLPDGTEITVRFADDTVETLRVVKSVEEVSDRDRATVVTPDSPLGRALFTHRVGDVVTYPTPDGTGRAELLELRLPGDPTAH